MNFTKTTLWLIALSLLSPFAKANESISGRAAVVMTELNFEALSSVSQEHSNPFSPTIASLWENLRGRFHMNEVNSELIRNHERKFATSSSTFNRTINRSRPYMYHIVTEVQKRGMPAEIALLPFIESAYVTRARSHVGASGLWQFMPATGRHFGLEQTPLYDGRHDIYAATDAALNYLSYLYGLFGDWPLALAAYNWGEGNVSRAIRKASEAGLHPTYENIKMPAETRNYVPKLLAVRNIINNPKQFNINLPEIRYEPYFKAIDIHNPLDITTAAKLANISESEFLALNPAFKTPVFIPKSTDRKMLLPIHSVQNFEKNYQNTDSKELLSWDIFTPFSSMTLAEISVQTGTSIADLKRLNGITSNQVAAGRTLLVNKHTPTQSTVHLDFAKIDHDPNPDTFKEIQPINAMNIASKNSASNVAPLTLKLPENPPIFQNPSTKTTLATPQKTATPTKNSTTQNKTATTKTPATHKVSAGDTLYNIAQRYQVNLDDLKVANRIDGNTIHNGQILKISGITGQASKQKNTTTRKTPSTHTVKKGDTLERIAAQYNLKTSELKRLNKNTSQLQIGQKIRLTP